MNDAPKEPGEWDNIPIGGRFSLLYVDRGSGHSDSLRFRKRLYAMVKEDLDAATASTIERLVGVTVKPVGYGHYWREFFETAHIHDLLDTMPILVRAKHHSIRPGFMAEVDIAFRQEGLGYRLDPAGGVHYAKDEAFEATRQSAVSGLGSPRYAAALAAFDDAHRALDGHPPDTRAAIRHVFEACEIVFRLILGDKVARLGSAEVNSKLKPKAIDGLGPVAKEAVSGQLRTFATWVDAAHLYRHGQEIEAPAPPPEDVAVASVQVGTAFLRWLVAFDNSAE